MHYYAFMPTSVPEEVVLVQELLSANIRQRKHRVDSQEQSAVDGYQLQTLHTRLCAGQDLRVRLPQPVKECLEPIKWAFGEMEG